MDIWLIRNGEKYGPFPDYDIRRRIEGGELDPQSPAWHEGLASWGPISEIAIFKNEFAPKPKPIPIEEIPVATQPAGPPPVPTKTKIFRRFWARWLDLTLFFAAFWLIAWATGRDVEAIFLSPWVSLAQFLPWFVIEIFLIHSIATTPGKWLFGMRVLNADGSRLSWSQSAQRSMSVYVLGIGLAWFPLAILAMGLSVYTAKRMGAPVWDHVGKHRVTTKKINPAAIIVAVFLFLGSSQAVNGVLSPYTLRVQMEFITKYAPQYAPQFRRELEKNPPWSLPRRHK